MRRAGAGACDCHVTLLPVRGCPWLALNPVMSVAQAASQDPPHTPIGREGEKEEEEERVECEGGEEKDEEERRRKEKTVGTNAGGRYIIIVHRLSGVHLLEASWAFCK